MSSLSPSEWNIYNPSVIRDSINGRLGYQQTFGTTYISGATQAIAIHQNPLDSSSTAGDAVLYIGTTNGGIYMRSYDYSTDTWADEWDWLSQPTATAGSGYEGNQGIGTLAVSPDGSLIAVGRGNPSNYNFYTPNGPALQFGQIQPDGSINWLVTPAPDVLAGLPNAGNIRNLEWRTDGLYVSTAGGANGTTYRGYVYRLKIDASGQLTEPATEIESYPLPMPLDGLSQGSDSVYFSMATAGIYYIDGSAQAQLIDSQSSGWSELWNTRLTNREMVGRIVVAEDPAVSGGRVILVGWYQYPASGDVATGLVSHVDRISLDQTNAVTSVESLDFTGKAGSGQAAIVGWYGNYSLAFDTADATLNTVLVGGNQYSTNHPDNAAAYSFTGGLVRGAFDTGGISAVYGPYATTDGQLVEQSLYIGAPHADSRTIAYLQTPDGSQLIASDDGGIWQLSPSSQDPSVLTWSSLNAPGLHSLETISSGWDARSNSLIQAHQDNAISLSKVGDTYSSNIWQGDGNLALIDGAMPTDQTADTWTYVNSQKYMIAGYVLGLALDSTGSIDTIRQLTLTTNVDGSSVQPVALAETYALAYAGLSTASAPSSFPAEVNPYRSGDIVLAGNSGIYETFVPNWSDYASATAIGTLQVVPVIPGDTAARQVTAVSIGSIAAQSAEAAAKPFFWDAMVATTWNASTQQSVVWYRNATSLDSVPSSLADVSTSFLSSIQLSATALSNRIITDVAHVTDANGQLTALYALEGQQSLRYLSVSAATLPLSPTSTDEGAALIVVQGENVTRLPYAQLAGLSDLVQSGDMYGPTSIEILPAKDGRPAELIVGGEHGLYRSYLDGEGNPLRFEAMSIHGLGDGVQYGSAIMELTYNAADDLLVASVLGGGSFLYSRSGDIGSTPANPSQLVISETTVPQNAAEMLDKRGNSVKGNFAIELPDSAFDDSGIATANFVIPDVALWKQHIEGVSLYQSVVGDFNLLDTTESTIRERLTFTDFASLRLGTFLTKSNAQELPTVVLPFQVELLNSSGDIVETVTSSINLVPNGTTPSFARYTGWLPEGRAVFQAKYGFGDGVDFQKLPFYIKAALPASLPEGTEIFAYQVAGQTGAIIYDGQTYVPGDAGYTEAALADRLDTGVSLSAGQTSAADGLILPDLTALFEQGDLSAFLQTEGNYFGTTMTVSMPEVYGQGIPNQTPLIGIGMQYPDGEIALTTVDLSDFSGNTINFNPGQENQAVTLDVGYGGIFAAQQTGGDISIAKLGRLDSSVGFVRVDDLFGTIDGITPGEDGYAQAALGRSISEGLDVSLTQGYGTSQTYTLGGFVAGCYYACYITPDAQTAAQALSNLPVSAEEATNHVLFSFDQANPTTSQQGQGAAIPFSNDMIAFEDMPLAGDMDFNDIVIYFGSVV